MNKNIKYHTGRSIRQPTSTIYELMRVYIRPTLLNVSRPNKEGVQGVCAISLQCQRFKSVD